MSYFTPYPTSCSLLPSALKPPPGISRHLPLPPGPMQDSHEAVIEQLFTSVYTTLARMDEHLSNVKGEIYVWHFWGHYFFLPGTAPCGWRRRDVGPQRLDGMGIGKEKHTHIVPHSLLTASSLHSR